MADFCKQCSIDMFGKDFGDLKGITNQTDLNEGLAASVLCEDCGPIQVDTDGKCITNCIKSHGVF